MMARSNDNVIVDVPTTLPSATNSRNVAQTAPGASNNERQRQPQQSSERHQAVGEESDLLYRAVQDAGRWAYGTVFVEVWVLNDTKTKLIQPSGGCWVDSAFEASALASNSADAAAAAHGLLDPTSPNYLAPIPVSQGVGLAGVLWAEVQPSSSKRGTDNNDLTSQANPIHHLQSSQQQQQQHRPVVWRHLEALSKDPDQPYDKRIKLMVRCGLGWAAAVALDHPRHQGIIIYVARQTTNRDKLQSASNEAYLQSAADWIGSAYALREPRRDAVLARKSELTAALKRARIKLLALKHMGFDLATLIEKPKPTQPPTPQYAEEDGEERKKSMFFYYCDFVTQHVKDKTTSLANKCKGGNVPPPPAFTWEQTIWTFCGVFLTLLMIIRTNVYLKGEYGNDYTISLGPTSALVTLLYGLTAAPASQPRNAICGQALSATIGLTLSYWKGLHLIWRQGISTALAVGAMVRLGLTHPPAGATAFLFCTREYHWGNMAFLLVANIIAIGTATLINNLSDKRQYPTSWGFRPLLELLESKKLGDGGDDGELDKKK